MRIKFINLNIWKGNLLEKIVAYLRKEDPDIIALQEVYNGTRLELSEKYQSFSFLKEQLVFEYASFSPAFSDQTHEVGVENGNALYSRFPIISTATTFYDVPYGDYADIPENYEYCPRNLQHTCVKINSKTLDIFNTHGIYGLDGRDNERRLSMSKTIVDAVKGKERVILAGDFNLPPDTQTIKNIAKHLVRVFQKDGLTTTFNMKRKDDPDYGKVVVDMIFVSSSIKVLKRSCPKVDVSDHLPLICVLEI